MKNLTLIIIIFLPLVSLGQDIQLRKKIDSIVAIIDARSSKKVSFSRQGRIAQNKVMNFRYHYKSDNGRLNYIVREFSDKDSLVKQVFYVSGSLLIFSTESITYYYGKDSIQWAGSYYFSNEKLKDYETLGHGKSEIDTWNPEKEVLSNYRKARADVSAYMMY